MTAQDHLFSAPQTARTSDDYYTPKWLFETLDVRFSMDVSAPPGGVPWIPADQYLTKAEDGLLVPWEGRVWMNPPFSNVSPWAKKFMDHRLGIALLPIGRNRWSQTLWESDCYYVYLDCNFKFVRGTNMKGIFMPTALVTFEDELVENLARIGRVR